MNLTLSTYEAKARFSEVIRLVREGRTVHISYHGKPVAEIRPIQGKRKRRWKSTSTIWSAGALFRRPRIPTLPSNRSLTGRGLYSDSSTNGTDR